VNHAAAGRHSPVSDEQEARLLRQVALQDRDALAQLYALYHRRLARFLGRFLRQYEVVQEIVNDTMFIVWRQAGQFRGGSRVSTWIMGIAYRRALKSLRQSAARLPSQATANPPQPVAGDAIEEAEQRELVSRALGTLPLEQRVVLELTYYVGYSCEEVAAIVQCPVNTVKTRMFHARRKLKDLLPGLAGWPLE
jgi:RNA polymerase sigma-70 factor (ECF subfamily)